MPYSLVLYCYPKEDLAREEIAGKRLHGIFFNLLREADSRLTDELCQKNSSPFTLSPLFLADEKKTKGAFIKAGTQCRLRMTLLKDELFFVLNQLSLEHTVRTIILENIPLIVTHILTTSESLDLWSNFSGYETLLINASPSWKEVTLQFFTPTAFNRGDINFPLPDPQLIFSNYLEKWNQYSSIPLSENIPILIENSIFLSNFRISPQWIDVGFSKEIGFTGWCTFILKGRHPEEHIREFNLLADFAYYCGTGIKTAMGMGMTRKIWESGLHYIKSKE